MGRIARVDARDVARPTSRLDLDLDGDGTDRRRAPACRSSTTCSTRSGVTACFDLAVAATGDLEVDAHHTVEDVGHLPRAGDRRGTRRQGGHHARSARRRCPDGRGARARRRRHLRPRRSCTTTSTCPSRSSARSTPRSPRSSCVALATNAGLTLHVRSLAGENAHHIIEAAFKAVARALREAVALDPRVSGVPSHEGRAVMIAIVDYRMGNLRSVEKGFEHAGVADVRRDRRPGGRRGRRRHRAARAWARSATRPRNLRESGRRGRAARPHRRGHAVPRHLPRACSCSPTSATRTASGQGLGLVPGHVRAAARRA